ncbi:MAG: hypothetical protein DRJ08_02415 [Acidobacteria bacterium]|nr:MAG: hypothetical protein DRJ08_02415 [Acidobacteriota bacterium]
MQLYEQNTGGHVNRDFYIRNGTKQSGPYTEAEIQAYVHSGHITPQSLCWREGMTAWLPAWQMFPGFFPSPQTDAPTSVSPPPDSPDPLHPATTASPPPPRKRSCCCSGCLILILLIILLIGGIAGVAWYKYRQPPSPVDKEYKTIPDYFPPASKISSSFIPDGGIK